MEQCKNFSKKVARPYEKKFGNILEIVEIKVLLCDLSIATAAEFCGSRCPMAGSFSSDWPLDESQSASKAPPL